MYFVLKISHNEIQDIIVSGNTSDPQQDFNSIQSVSQERTINFDASVQLGVSIPNDVQITKDITNLSDLMPSKTDVS